MPQLKIDLRRPTRLPEALPAALRDTVEHLPERVQADVPLPDVDLASLREIARGAVDRAPDRLPSRAELAERMPTRTQIVDALPAAVVDRLPIRRSRRSPFRYLLGAATVAGIAAVVMSWARVQPWLEARIADARDWLDGGFDGATGRAFDEELEAFPAAQRAPIAPAPYADELRPEATGLSTEPGELPAGMGTSSPTENGLS